MKTIIPLNGLVARLALRENISEEQAREFIIRFFGTLEQSLSLGEWVAIKGLGRFDVTDRNVTFTPEPAFAARVNEPFDMFMPMELSDDFDASILDDTQASTTTPEPDVAETPTPDQPEQNSPVPEQPVIEAPVQELQREQPTQTHPLHQETQHITPQQPLPIVQPLIQQEQMAEEQKNTNPTLETTPCHRRVSRSCVALWALICLLVGLALGIWIGYSLHDKISVIVADNPTTTPEKTVEEILEPVDTMPVQVTTDDIERLNDPTTDPENALGALKGKGADKSMDSSAQPKNSKPVKTIRTDTVTSKRYPATMAREYYGNDAYWVYIFMANRDKYPKLRNYGAGAVVVIPDFDSCRTSSDPAKNLQDAVNLAARIAAEQ